MCNLYSLTKGQAAILQLARAMRDRTGNLPPMPGIFPDYMAPIIRQGPEERQLAMARWGMPTPSSILHRAAAARADKMEAKGKVVDREALKRAEADAGVTNVRNVTSPHWRRWLGLDSRCVVPFTSFSEWDPATKGPAWFALSEERPLAFFAGIWTSNWTSVRKAKVGEETADLFAFLTTDAVEPVAAIHPKAMPVILTTPEEVETWLTAPWAEASQLQRPIEGLRIVARGAKQDGVVG
jgi:putative SOS response-associated peptidase YedK